MLEELQSVLHIHTFWDGAVAVIDFAIVGFLIYQVLLMIRGTRAVPMMYGLLFIILGYFLSERVGLSTLNWMLDKFIASFIVVVIVLFQDDIRRGLLKVGQSRLFSGLGSSVSAYVVEELVRGCFALSEVRIGALIVVERDGDLSEYAQEAIKVDAAVTREQLFAIFNPANANPLHDGAVIVRGDRVLVAGGFLPLTSSPRVDKSLGTRHRAALGLSEETDSVVLVVSEETGAVSIALGGQLIRGLEPNTLRERLQELLGVRADAEGREGRRPKAQARRGDG